MTNRPDRLEALLTRLGGVYFVPFDNLAQATVSILANTSGATSDKAASATTGSAASSFSSGRWQFTPAETHNWRLLRTKLVSWNGTFSGLEDLYAINMKGE